jgi:hypothetical protein
MSTKPTVESVRADLIAEQDALDAVVGELDADHWVLETPSPRWTIADQIGHLTYFDWTAALAITDPDRFTTNTAEMMGALTAGAVDAMDLATLGDYRAMNPEELCHAWRTNRGVLSEASASLADDSIKRVLLGNQVGSDRFDGGFGAHVALAVWCCRAEFGLVFVFVFVFGEGVGSAGCASDRRTMSVISRLASSRVMPTSSRMPGWLK